eukprot:TRINITY_DN10456_c0_g1_i2.p1 TRINITY_DN10456_c0_g1~~TRINITY_DN10456_c0_g1_i2.p1  ORF type:complete len:211 (+),score=23.79 TRINITY_DN10456_c0_g1_i2:6-638(+)
MGNCNQGSNVRCGKCDGRHETDSCKIYPKPRDSHPDARPHTPTASEDKDVLIKDAAVVRQPADNHCLYHALSHGLKKRRSPRTLRKELSTWVLENQQTEVKGRKLIDWLKEEYPNEDSEQYAELMKSSTRWGGLPELQGCSQLYNVNIRVWDRKKNGFRLLSNFQAAEETQCTIDLLYNRKYVKNVWEIWVFFLHRVSQGGLQGVDGSPA